MPNYTPTDRTRVVRIPDRGKYDAGAVHAILDEGLVCHVGFVVDAQPFVIPTLYARNGAEILFHGSAASRMLRNISDGIRICLTVTLIDGIVMARSAFHHSINYRSVVALGLATQVLDEKEKMAALHVFTERIMAGRWADVRTPTAQELLATTVLRLPLEEVSAKVRSGPPKDDEADYALPIWAGVLPLTLQPGSLVPDPRLLPGLEPPKYATIYSRKGAA